MDLRGVVRRTIELASAVERNIPTQGTPYPTHRKTAPPLESQPNENAVQTKVCSRRRSKPVSRVLFSCAPSGIEWTRDALVIPRTYGVAIIYLGALLPVRSSDQPECVAGNHMCTPIRSCSRWGLPSQLVSELLVRSYRTVASLPVLVHARAIGGLHFCGTIPKIALAGRYPAPCPMELGLSSRAAFRHCTGDCPAYFFVVTAWPIIR